MSTITSVNRTKQVWEGWTVEDFIDSLVPEIDRIMTGRSRHRPFASKQELDDWCRENQPYYKRRIPGVNNHFARMYNLK